MDVLQGPDALQLHPILEPQHSILSFAVASIFAIETVGKVPLHKGCHAGTALGRHVARVRVCRDQRARPDDNVGDVGREAVGPVVDEHAVVAGISKGRCGRGHIRRAVAPSLGQAVDDEVAGDGAILGLCIGCPLHVPPQV